MSTITEIKNDLISKIKHSKNLNLLKALQSVLTDADEELFQLSNEQLASIEAGRLDVKQGKVISNDNAFESLKQWLRA